MVEKKKILKQLVFFVCILIASSSIVNAQTTRARCPAGTALISGTNKCCPSYNVNGKSIKATETTKKINVYMILLVMAFTLVNMFPERIYIAYQIDQKTDV